MPEPSNLDRIDRLAQEIERWTDSQAQSTARELIQSVLDFHAAALAKIIDHIQNTDRGSELLDNCLTDPQIAALFLLHDLHPRSLEDRVEEALVSVRPYLQSHGGDVELLAIDGDTVTIRLEGSCRGCPSSAATLQSTIEQAIYKAAPDIQSIEVATAAINHSDLLQISPV